MELFLHQAIETVSKQNFYSISAPGAPWHHDDETPDSTFVSNRAVHTFLNPALWKCELVMQLW